jgi:hypothetical protein
MKVARDPNRYHIVILHMVPCGEKKKKKLWCITHSHWLFKGLWCIPVRNWRFNKFFKIPL